MSVSDRGHGSGSHGPDAFSDVHTQPDHGVVGRTPDVYTQPDHVEYQPDAYTLPDEVQTPPDCRPQQPSMDELDIALRRAQLVAEDISSVLDPALKAMEDGAWVSRTADEFSTGLTTHARQAATVAERCVESVQEAIDVRGPIDVDPRPL